jgi:hypothetical protein
MVRELAFPEDSKQGSTPVLEVRGLSLLREEEPWTYKTGRATPLKDVAKPSHAKLLRTGKDLTFPYESGAVRIEILHTEPTDLGGVVALHSQ